MYLFQNIFSILNIPIQNSYIGLRFFYNHKLEICMLFLLSLTFMSTLSKFAYAQDTQPEEKGTQIFHEIDNNLSLMAGQMILTGFKGLSLSEDVSTVEALKNGTLGGVILFYKHKDIVAYNLASPTQATALLQEIKTYSRFPLFIGIDQEGGRVQRISALNGFKNWPSAEELGRGDTSNTYKSVKDMATTLAELGFNLNFAPCIDLLDPNSPAIGKRNRAFDPTALKVANHARAFSRALEENHIIPTLKHFPGHGSAQSDTHDGFTDVTKTWQEKELLPYKILIDDGFSGMIMTAHVYNANFDDKPASLSHAITTKVLRERLGFKGVIITDDLQMKAVSSHYSLKETVYLAISGGSDILLFGNNLIYDKSLAQNIHNAILTLVEEGRISKERIEESWQRIRAMKMQYLLK